MFLDYASKQAQLATSAAAIHAEYADLGGIIPAQDRFAGCQYACRCKSRCAQHVIYILEADVSIRVQATIDIVVANDKFAIGMASSGPSLGEEAPNITRTIAQRGSVAACGKIAHECHKIDGASIEEMAQASEDGLKRRGTDGVA